jgi:hypothetical protein
MKQKHAYCKRNLLVATDDLLGEAFHARLISSSGLGVCSGAAMVRRCVAVSVSPPM